MKILGHYFVEIDKPFLKFIWRGKRAYNSQHNIEGEQDGGLSLRLIQIDSSQHSVVLAK